jgi:Protein of unknown function (DUF2612)
MTRDDYLDLITSQHRLKPKFTAMVAASVDCEVYLQGLLDSMIDRFDIDGAVGDQLDIIGQWIGVSRNVSIPIASVYFAWDSTALLGWDSGTWQPPLSPTSITTLPDDAYRTLLKARRAANRWDGTTEGAYTIWVGVFGSTVIAIQDNGNMTYAVAVIGGIVDALTLALLTKGYIGLKPETIQITEYYLSITSDPLFSWDENTDYLAGWDEGYYALEVIPT